MKQFNLWLSLLTIIFVFTSCELENVVPGNNNGGGNGQTDVDANLSFTDKPVEQQKQEIEAEALAFIDAVEGLKDTEFVQTLLFVTDFFDEAFYNVLSVNEVYAISSKFATRPVSTGFELQKTLRKVTTEDEEFWGHWVYNFEKEEFEKKSSTANTLIIEFPASKASYIDENNDGKLSFNFTDSDVAIPWQEENDEFDTIYYPSNIKIKLTAGTSELLDYSFIGTYLADGSPQNITQILKIDNIYSWNLSLKNTQSSLSETYSFLKGKTVLMASAAELKGNFTLQNIESNLGESFRLEEIFTSFKGTATVMGIGILIQMDDFGQFYDDMMASFDENLSYKQAAKLKAKAFNNNLIASGYFVKEQKKFADLKFDIYEYTEWYYDNQTGQWDSFINYAIEPIFILSDKSGVYPEAFVEDGFGTLITRVEELMEELEKMLNQ